jgi:CRP/FNR family transcriptional regulator
MRNLANMPVKGLVAQALLTLKEKFGANENGFIDLALSRQDHVSYTGAHMKLYFVC